MAVKLKENDVIDMASPEFGIAANSYLSLVNVKDKKLKIGHGMNGMSPGVGAISPHYNHDWYAQHDIPPKGELFVRNAR
jgi:glutamate synthase domain-containing protein 2